jgi:hypothetical protein
VPGLSQHNSVVSSGAGHQSPCWHENPALFFLFHNTELNVLKSRAWPYILRSLVIWLIQKTMTLIFISRTLKAFAHVCSFCFKLYLDIIRIIFWFYLQILYSWVTYGIIKYANEFQNFEYKEGTAKFHETQVHFSCHEIFYGFQILFWRGWIIFWFYLQILYSSVTYGIIKYADEFHSFEGRALLSFRRTLSAFLMSWNILRLVYVCK